jgi:hypothetical protein
VKAGSFQTSACDLKYAKIGLQNGAVIVQTDLTNQNHSIAPFSFGAWPHFESWRSDWNDNYKILGRFEALNCQSWIEEPTLVVVNAFPANYWHALADTFAISFATLVEAGIWDDHLHGFKTIRISVQPYARHPSPYYKAIGQKHAAPENRVQARARFVKEGHFAVDRYKLLELLSPFPFVFDSSFDDSESSSETEPPASSGTNQLMGRGIPFEQPPPNTCYRRLLVGFSATLDFNIDSRYLGKQGVQKRKAMMARMVDFVLRKFSLPSVRTIDLPMRPLVTIINRSGGDRRFGNLDGVLQWARDFGIDVEVVDFNKAPLSEVVSLMQRTTVLFGIHGAGFTNLAFLRPGAVVAMLQPTRTFSYFPDFFVNMAEAVGVSFVTRDIACCSSRSEVHNVSRAGFVDMMGEVLQSGYHITMPKTWKLH